MSEKVESLVTSDDLISIEITTEEKEKLACESKFTDYQRSKLNRDAKKNWDLFYKRNGDRFFKNRYWTKHEFCELFAEEKSRKLLLEIGCGCGDFVLPLLEENLDFDTSKPLNLFIYCCDLSEKAIEILKSNPKYIKNHPQKIKAFVANITDDGSSIISQLDDQLVDVVSLIFVLSSIDPVEMKKAVDNVYKVLKPGGLVLFRDYAIFDKAMLRFSGDSKICDQFYVRQDGTRAYFFEKKNLVELLENSNFKCLSIDYIRRETINKATKDKFSRIFLQAKFTK